MVHGSLLDLHQSRFLKRRTHSTQRNFQVPKQDQGDYEQEDGGTSNGDLGEANEGKAGLADASGNAGATGDGLDAPSDAANGKKKSRLTTLYVYHRVVVYYEAEPSVFYSSLSPKGLTG